MKYGVAVRTLGTRSESELASAPPATALALALSLSLSLVLGLPSLARERVGKGGPRAKAWRRVRSLIVLFLHLLSRSLAYTQYLIIAKQLLRSSNSQEKLNCHSIMEYLSCPGKVEWDICRGSTFLRNSGSNCSLNCHLKRCLQMSTVRVLV